MRKGKIALLIISILLILMVSLYFDNLIVKKISLTRNYIFDEFFMGVAFISSEIIIFFLLTSLFLWQEHKRKWIIPLWATLGISLLIGFFLKITIQRLRPYQLNLVNIIPILQKNSHLIWNFSFPSFHSLLAFCAIPILSIAFPKLKKAWILFAVIIAFSRIYFGLHFLSDVIAGGIMGYLIGLLIIKIEKETRFGEKITQKIKKNDNSRKIFPIVISAFLAV